MGFQCKIWEFQRFQKNPKPIRRSDVFICLFATSTSHAISDVISIDKANGKITKLGKSFARARDYDATSTTVGRGREGGGLSYHLVGKGSSIVYIYVYSISVFFFVAPGG